MSINKINVKISILASIIVLALIIFLVIKNQSKEPREAEDILEVNIIIKDHMFSPKIIEVPSRKKLRLVIHNHDDTVEEFESNDLHRERIVMPNNSTTIILAPLAPGKYDFFGDFHQETAQGSLIVH